MQQTLQSTQLKEIIQWTWKWIFKSSFICSSWFLISRFTSSFPSSQNKHQNIYGATRYLVTNLQRNYPHNTDQYLVIGHQKPDKTTNCPSTGMQASLRVMLGSKHAVVWVTMYSNFHQGKWPKRGIILHEVHWTNNQNEPRYPKG